jgi:hypothetical protein
MWKKLLPIFVLCLLAVGVLAQEGVDDEGNPNNPNENDRANACYSGGTMEGKCDTEWEWVCGWYMIRFDAGLFTREEIPFTCAVLLPAEEDGDSSPDYVCIDVLGVSLFCHVSGNVFTEYVSTLHIFYLILPNGSGCPASYNGYNMSQTAQYVSEFEDTAEAFVNSFGFADTDVICGYET